MRQPNELGQPNGLDRGNNCVQGKAHPAATKKCSGFSRPRNTCLSDIAGCLMGTINVVVADRSGCPCRGPQLSSCCCCMCCTVFVQRNGASCGYMNVQQTNCQRHCITRTSVKVRACLSSVVKGGVRSCSGVPTQLCLGAITCRALTSSCIESSSQQPSKSLLQTSPRASLSFTFSLAVPRDSRYPRHSGDELSHQLLLMAD